MRTFVLLVAIVAAACGQSESEKQAEAVAKAADEIAKAAEKGAEATAKQGEQASNDMAKAMQDMAAALAGGKTADGKKIEPIASRRCRRTCRKYRAGKWTSRKASA
jgi:hypothetical protein